MIRTPRVWSKKRGGRLLAQRFGGVVGEAMFYASLVFAGVLTLAITIAGQFNSEDWSGLSVGYGFWVAAIASVSLIAIGSVCLASRILGVGASSERRAALTARAEDLEVAGTKPLPKSALPSVPVPPGMTDSPGVRLAYRLPEIDSPIRALGASAVLAITWNGLWLVCVVAAVESIARREPRWMLMGLLVPLGGVGWWAFRSFLMHVRRHAGLGPTIVEISALPLVPGTQYQIYLSQLGRLRLKSLSVALVCEEEATFRQGTDVRVERQPVLEHSVWSGQRLVVDPGEPFEQEFPVVVPAGAMHSFQSPHNAVRWTVVVRGESRRWPSFCRTFPVVVHPRVVPLGSSPSSA
jgi:hypothetical protein